MGVEHRRFQVSMPQELGIGILNGPFGQAEKYQRRSWEVNPLPLRVGGLVSFPLVKCFQTLMNFLG